VDRTQVTVLGDEVQEGCDILAIIFQYHSLPLHIVAATRLSLDTETTAKFTGLLRFALRGYAWLTSVYLSTYLN
jgi:hypothetical protein